ILVCSDIVSPAMARRGNFDFILAQNSLGIFNGSSLLESQLIAISRTRAVENEKYLALVSNFGRSFVIDSQGNIQKITDSGGYKILTGDIVPSSVQTWYNKLGDWPILALSLVFIACALFSKFLGQFFKKIK
ncbi:MAG TPA: nitrilase-related carbon-nitrogen hydrolase, partial [Patescibacteria group bacterium]|nr:nitrilase-related carbon-nitrogen hydrolase [Patescibacteria group bacterium]